MQKYPQSNDSKLSTNMLRILHIFLNIFHFDLSDTNFIS